MVINPAGRILGRRAEPFGEGRSPGHNRYGGSVSGKCAESGLSPNEVGSGAQGQSESSPVSSVASLVASPGTDGLARLECPEGHQGSPLAPLWPLHTSAATCETQLGPTVLPSPLVPSHTERGAAGRQAGRGGGGGELRAKGREAGVHRALRWRKRHGHRPSITWQGPSLHNP